MGGAGPLDPNYTIKNMHENKHFKTLRIDYCDERLDYLNGDISDTKGGTYSCNVSL